MIRIRNRSFPTMLLHKIPFPRLDWNHLAPREATAVVKGMHRRVVIVKSPNPRIFEEAIFIIREDFLQKGSSSEEVLDEARRAADEYVKMETGKKKRLFSRFPGPLFAAAGAAAAGIAWLAMHLVGV